MILHSFHFLKVLEERRLDKLWVERTILRPDWIEPDANDPELTRAFRAVPERDFRIMRVVYRPEGEGWRVVTAFLDRGAKKK